MIIPTARFTLISSARIFVCITCLALAFKCTPTERKNDDPSTRPVVSAVLPDATKEIEDSIRAEFPGATPAHIYADSIIDYVLKKYRITTDQMLLGASTCADDIIYTKNFQAHREIKGPFHLGGLAGLPFSGISGLSAFAHHIPENGTMVLLVAPHIGYSKAKGWGYILRSGQHEPSTCCGALMGTLKKMEKGGLKQAQPTSIDYQGVVINNLVLQHEQEIAGHHNPIATLTKIIYEDAERQILDQVKAVEIEHINYIITMSGVMINTDYEYTDYLWLNHFSVFDVRNKVFLEDKRN